MAARVAPSARCSHASIPKRGASGRAELGSPQLHRRKDERGADVHASVARSGVRLQIEVAPGAARITADHGRARTSGTAQPLRTSARVRRAAEPDGGSQSAANADVRARHTSVPANGVCCRAAASRGLRPSPCLRQNVREARASRGPEATDLRSEAPVHSANRCVSWSGRSVAVNWKKTRKTFDDAGSAR